MQKTRLKNSGFTLLELMITLSVAGILLSLAIPSFQELMTNNRTATNANRLVTALNLARSEAVKRGVQVTVKRKPGTNNNNSEWEPGWDIFTDLDGDGTLDEDGDANLCETNGDDPDCLLQTYGELTNDYTLRTGANFATWVAYLPTGFSRSSGGGLANDTFRLCDKSANTSKSRAIVLNAVGRIRTQEGTASCP